VDSEAGNPMGEGGGGGGCCCGIDEGQVRMLSLGFELSSAVWRSWLRVSDVRYERRRRDSGIEELMLGRCVIAAAERWRK